MGRLVVERKNAVLSRKFLLIGLVFVVPFLVFGVLKFAFAAEAPAIVTYQGKIQVDGEAATTTLSMKFVLYDALTSGNALYSAGGTTSSPSAISVTPSAGIFSVNLGDTGTNSLDVTIFKSNASVYLEVIVGSETLSPRKRITAAPYAYNAKYLDGVAASSTSPAESHIALSDSSGNFDFNNVTTTKIYNNGTFEVTGNSTLTNVSSTNITASGYLNVAGNSTLTNVSSTNITGSGYLNITGNSTLTNVSSTNVTASGYLNVAGQSTFGNVSSTNYTASGYLNVAGQSTLTNVSSTNITTSGYLSVTGNATFSATTTMSTTTMDRLGIGTANPSEDFHMYDGTLLVDSPVNPTLKGSYNTAGTSYRLHISGKYAYIADGSAGLVVVDVSNPAFPTLIGSVDTGDAKDVVVSGGYAYVAGGTTNELSIIDVSNPSSPVIIKTHNNLDWSINSLFISGKLLYAGGDAGKLFIFDISNPDNIVQRTEFDSGAGQTIGGIYVSEKHAYLAAGTAGIYTVDVSDPTDPFVTASNDTNGSANDVYVSGMHAYLADGSRGLKIFDISNPSALTLQGSYDTLAIASSTVVYGKYAYVADFGSLRIIDVSSSTAPTEIGSYETVGNPFGVRVAGKYAYVADGTNGLVILDIKGADMHAADIGSLSASALTVWDNVDIGNNLYIRDGLNVGNGGILSNGSVAINVSSTISDLKLFNVGTSTASDFLTVFSNGYIGVGTDVADAQLDLYRAGNSATDKILEVSSDAGSGILVYGDGRTVMINVSSTNQDISGYLSVAGNSTFSATTTMATTTITKLGVGTASPSETLHINGGNILHVANGGPTLKGLYNTNGDVMDVYVSGKYAYVADATDGLLSFDITDPTEPVRVGACATPGEAVSVYVAGNYAYVGDVNTEGLRIVDVTNPSNMTIVGNYNVDNSITSVYISGSYAYLGDVVEGVKILNISNPSNPVLVGTFPSAPLDMYISGKYAYVASGTLEIVDISDKGSPLSVTSTSIDGDANAVYVSGAYAYVADWTSPDLHILDISDPTEPEEVGSFTLSGDATDVYVAGNYAYVTDLVGGLTVLDISSSTNITLVGTYATAGSATSVFVAGKYAYVGDGGVSENFYVLDINGLDTPAISTGNISSNALTVWENANVGNNLYVNNGLNVGLGGILSNGPVAITVSTTQPDPDGYNLFTVGDVATNNFLVIASDGSIGFGTSTPSAKMHIYGGNILHTVDDSMERLGSYNTSGTAYSVYVSGKYAYVADYAGGMSIIDISDPTSLSLVGSSDTIDSAISILVAGNFAYVGEANGRLEILNISDPKTPVNVGSVDLGDYSITGVDISGRYVYVANASDGMQVVDISVPENPQIFGSDENFSGQAQDVYAVGNYVYLADASTPGLQVVDISDPSSPTTTGFASLDGIGLGIYVSGRYAYVVDNLGLSIVDISDPSSPTTTGFVAISGIPSHAYVAGKYAYISGGTSGLVVVDVSDPSSPVVAGTVALFDNAYDVYVAGKYAYVADGTYGLRVVDINGLETPTLYSGNTQTNLLTVTENTDIGNNLYVRNGLNVGFGGILSQGVISIGVEKYFETDLFLINSPTTTGGNITEIFAVDSDGRVLINTSTPPIGDGGYGYKLLVDSGDDDGDGIGVRGGVTSTGPMASLAGLDLAENYPINALCKDDDSCPIAGDVVCFDPSVVAGVKKCSAIEKNKMVGIVSVNPGFLLSDGDLGGLPNDSYGRVKVALTGRVPVKVSAENGAIVVGDKLTLSSIDGVAAKAVGEAPVLAMAMEAFAGPGEGTVVAFVNLGWQNKLYEALTVDETNKKLTIGSDLTPYNVNLYGELAMFSDTVSRVFFNSQSLFETTASGTHAFVFNAVNFADESDKYLLSLRSNNISKFSVSANGDVRANGNIYAASAIFGTSTNPGDLAERVDIAPDDIVEPGDVLVVDMNSPDTYRRSAGVHEQAVAGVVSTNPTIIVGNGRTEYTAIMAMVGRVPVKVSNENGAIMRGDLLVTASTTGYAMKYDPKKDTTKMAGVIGVALEPFNGGFGKIMSLIRAGWVNSKDETLLEMKQEIQQLAIAQGINVNASSTENLSVGNSGGKLVYNGGNLDLGGNLLLNVASVSGKDNKWAIDANGNFITRLDTSSGSKEMYAIQSPSSEFVFSSSSQLIAGEARIVFDAQTQEIIDANSQIKVTVTLTSNAKGVFISEKSAQGFVAKELDGGQSNATFDWVVVAKRKNVEAIVPEETGTANEQSSNQTPQGEANNENSNMIPPPEQTEQESPASSTTPETPTGTEQSSGTSAGAAQQPEPAADNSAPPVSSNETTPPPEPTPAPPATE